MDPNVQDILETVIFIKDRMATKDDIARLDARIGGVENRMESVEERLEKLDTKMDDHFRSLKNEIGGVHHRIDHEIAERKNLESRVGAVLPNLPPRPEHV